MAVTTEFSFSIFSVIFFPSNQVCIFVVWKQSIESGTYQLSVSRPGPGGRPLTYSINEGYSDTLLLPGSALKSSWVIDVDKPKLQGQLCPGKPGIFVLLGPSKQFLHKTRERKMKQQQQNGQVHRGSFWVFPRHTLRDTAVAAPGTVAPTDEVSRKSTLSSHLAVPTVSPHSHLLITEAKINSNWVGILYQSQSQPRGNSEAGSHSSQHKHKFVFAKDQLRAFLNLKTGGVSRPTSLLTRTTQVLVAPCDSGAGMGSLIGMAFWGKRHDSR